ncbi:MAG: tRNA (adenosine(37)-N6)-threonylcarbamoyltransferase complex transferase subunit TsaD [Abditibacteriales bacterium]|nr:tRNA (adenosine(37)-N6)-threonylcarbamoyltransferase complex transferase subunit TsaD [Abditibacteriales bacterium]MDW8365185.1 tRNA (adenosine(37)-N6)-threonylcarbamoyltransferase complex transferase subunit TsaD [Abditibacteriales bacterium]
MNPLTHEPLNILGIETSCDETSVAVVRDGREILSNLVASQMDLHAKFGGVVPEVASRKHVELLNPVLHEALAEAQVGFDDVDAIAVTHGPGLIGSLLVGVCAAKALGYVHRKPVLPINHLEGHIYANFLVHEDIEFPFVCLIVSGGHTDLILMREHGIYEVLGRTRDDAAGEAFDKVARVLGLGFPGGPAIQKAAEGGNPHAIRFPRADMGATLDFSFAGLKTSVMRFMQGLPTPETRHLRASDVPLSDIAASFQQAVVDVLVRNLMSAAERFRVSTVALAGGVAANRCLRATATAAAHAAGLRLLIPPIALCTDNAAMIAEAGYFHFLRGERGDLDFDTFAVLPLLSPS